MKPKNTICLWFDKDAHEAARFYAAARGMTCSIAARSRMSADERVVAPLATTGEYDDRQQRHHDQRLTYARIDEGGSKQRESQREHRHRRQQVVAGKPRAERERTRRTRAEQHERTGRCTARRGRRRRAARPPRQPPAQPEQRRHASDDPDQ
jgi:hypothetical protein